MFLRKYEVFFIVDPDLSDEETRDLETKLTDIVVREGGRVLNYASWGKRKLAYPVKKRDRGHYFLMEIAAGPELPTELERNMRIDERVLKFITVKLDDRFDPDKEQTDAAGEEKTEKSPVAESQESPEVTVESDESDQEQDEEKVE
ncbi:30S ribosomal protein S6 [Thermodesulforhabdus norvegica]|uniref:Small ribosomal subunit protein bS6 n=1 Tax=Thermodesulforhabdus norvegica TaxID=39841 RepID=A0A1I4U9N5_9BACT|nr:30S ribosomal protein S6 [Thermodesulforhabdus norvegica]SFM85433.1 small subunit ribosomal protein S6 [Thermodesulforhabdus norvegica]